MNPSKLIRVSSGDMALVCELNRTRTAQAIHRMASGDPPIRETGKILGKELYFLLPLRAWYRFFPDLKRQREVSLGDVAYWPRGGYLTFYFGPLPGNPPGRIMAHAPVVVVGRIVEGLDQFARFREFSMVEVRSLAPAGDTRAAPGPPSSSQG